MNNITKSASKIVFIMMALTACIAFMAKILPVDQFMLLAVAIFGFYTANKGNPEEPNAGK